MDFISNFYNVSNNMTISHIFIISFLIYQYCVSPDLGIYLIHISPFTYCSIKKNFLIFNETSQYRRHFLKSQFHFRKFISQDVIYCIKNYLELFASLNQTIKAFKKFSRNI